MTTDRPRTEYRSPAQLAVFQRTVVREMAETLAALEADPKADEELLIIARITLNDALAHYADVLDTLRVGWRLGTREMDTDRRGR